MLLNAQHLQTSTTCYQSLPHHDINWIWSMLVFIMNKILQIKRPSVNSVKQWRNSVGADTDATWEISKHSLIMKNE